MPEHFLDNCLHISDTRSFFYFNKEGESYKIQDATEIVLLSNVLSSLGSLLLPIKSSEK